MEIAPLGYSPRPQDLVRQKPVGQVAGEFAEALSSSLREIQQVQNRADGLAVQMALGSSVDVHDAVLAAEEANLAFQYTLQIRNKLIEAYQEVMRMQI